jgi:hypothetical protein
MLVRTLRSVSDSLHKEITAYERTLPRRTETSEHLFAVAATAGSVDADLEGLELFCDLGAYLGVISGNACNERSIRRVHRSEKLGSCVYDDDRVQRAEWLGVVE